MIILIQLLYTDHTSTDTCSRICISTDTEHVLLIQYTEHDHTSTDTCSDILILDTDHVHTNTDIST